MKCPVCSLDMESQKAYDITVDFCNYCGGLWLDGGELAEFIRKGKIPYRILTSYGMDDRKKKAGEGERICPVDSHKLKLFHHKGVNVDFCEHCDGLWFDRSELKSILLHYFEEVKEGKHRDPFGIKEDADNPIDEEVREGGGAEKLVKAIPKTLTDEQDKIKDPFYSRARKAEEPKVFISLKEKKDDKKEEPGEKKADGKITKDDKFYRSLVSFVMSFFQSR